MCAITKIFKWIFQSATAEMNNFFSIIDLAKLLYRRPFHPLTGHLKKRTSLLQISIYSILFLTLWKFQWKLEGCFASAVTLTRTEDVQLFVSPLRSAGGAETEISRPWRTCVRRQIDTLGTGVLL